MTSLRLHDVWMDYAGTPVLERVNLSLGPGEFCAVVGPSGCGKSTLLRLLLSIEAPVRGHIELDGRPLAREPRADRGVVFQRYSVFPHLRVIDNMLLGQDFAAARITGRLWGASRRRLSEAADQMLQEVGLAAARDKYPAQLSGGMQQRLALGQALMRQPGLLLLDEPFGALDPGTKSQMHTLLQRLWRERQMSVIMVTHDLSEAFQLASRVVALDRARASGLAMEPSAATVTFDIKVHRKTETSV